MPRAGLREILDALADQVRGVYDDQDDLAFQVEPRFVPNPSTPTIDMYLSDLARDTDTAAMGDLAGGYLITVRARSSTNDYDAMQDIFVDMTDDQDDLSLLAAVCDDETLNGYASDVDARDQTGLRVYADISGVGAYVGFELTVLVIPGES